MNEHTEIEKMPEILEQSAEVPEIQPKDRESESKCNASPVTKSTGEQPVSAPKDDGEIDALNQQDSFKHSTEEKKDETSSSISVSTDELLSSIPLVIQPPIVKGPEQPASSCIPSSSFREKVLSMRLPNAMQHRVYQYELPIEALTENIAHIQILKAGLEPLTTGLKVELQEKSICVHGTPTEKGTATLWVEYVTGEPNGNSKNLTACFPELTIFPDPKSLWKDLPVDESAPYQTPNEAIGGRFDISGKNIMLASKRGRSHAHEGKFRDDSFSFGWIPEYKWLIVAVSDGAGSAEFSRKGSEIACMTFVDELREKLSTAETNQKIDSLDKHNQEMALERLLFSTAHQAAVNIKDVASEHNDPVKKYSATFLGYIAKKFENEWLFVSVGIGDGAIALLDTENQVHLLNEPDGGEYVGQTRFLTTPEVWKDNHKRTFSIRVHDFQSVFSMTDGVSDPMFETDNNLKNSQKWIDFWNNLKNSKDNPIHFDKHEEQTQKELLAWLDFWSKGNHDDRTLAVLY